MMKLDLYLGTLIFEVQILAVDASLRGRSTVMYTDSTVYSAFACVVGEFGSKYLERERGFEPTLCVQLYT